jgi:predicted metal-dependent hydrolase
MLPRQGLEGVAPEGIDPELLPLAVESRRAWIEDAAARLAALGELPGMVPVYFPRRVVLTAFGLEYRVDCLERPGLDGFRIRDMGGGRLVVAMEPGGSREGIEAARQGLCAFVRDRAGPLLVAALREVGREAGLPFASARVRRQRTRWGSCSASGRISLNLALAFLPWDLVRYVFLHELCHTLHHDHSKRFWDAVRSVEPRAQALDAALSGAGHYVPLWFSGTVTAPAS